MYQPNENAMRVALDARESARNERFRSLSNMTIKTVQSIAKAVGLDVNQYATPLALMQAIVDADYPDLTGADNPASVSPSGPPSATVTAVRPGSLAEYADMLGAGGVANVTQTDEVIDLNSGGINLAHASLEAEVLLFVGYVDPANGATVKLDVNGARWVHGFSGNPAPVALINIPAWYIDDREVQDLIADTVHTVLSSQPEAIIDLLNSYASQRGWVTATELWQQKYSPAAPQEPSSDGAEATLNAWAQAVDEPTQMNPIVTSEN